MTVMLDEEIPPGPGLPAFVHRVGAPSWLFLILAAVVAGSELGAAGWLGAGHDWSLNDVPWLAWMARAVVLVLVPVLLLHRRPAALSDDRLLALAAILIAIAPVAEVASRVLEPAIFNRLFRDLVDPTAEPAWGATQMLLGVPGWLVAVATPFLVVRGFDGLDERPPARFRQIPVLLAVGGTTLLAAILTGATVLAISSAGTQITITSAGLVLQGALLVTLAAWTWASLAAWAAVRCDYGPWWRAVLAGAVLGSIVPTFVMGLVNVLFLARSDGGPVPDIYSVVTWIAPLLMSAGSVALAAAFALVPRARARVPEAALVSAGADPEGIG